jgi:hypothetical protein
MGGTSSRPRCPAHRLRSVEGFRAARAALAAFNPEFMVIFGDDQYENFREDGVAAFAVFALDESNRGPMSAPEPPMRGRNPPTRSSKPKATRPAAAISPKRSPSKISTSTGLTVCVTKTGCRTRF